MFQVCISGYGNADSQGRGHIPPSTSTPASRLKDGPSKRLRLVCSACSAVAGLVGCGACMCVFGDDCCHARRLLSPRGLRETCRQYFPPDCSLFLSIACFATIYPSPTLCPRRHSAASIHTPTQSWPLQGYPSFGRCCSGRPSRPHPCQETLAVAERYNQQPAGVRAVSPRGDMARQTSHRHTWEEEKDLVPPPQIRMRLKMRRPYQR